MADQKISQLTTIVTVDTASDLFPIVDTSAAETKKITPSALKTALALNNVDNTSDANKPISSATQSALNAKQDTLVSGTSIKTINSNSLLGSGDVAVQATLVSGTNIKTVNNTSLLGSGNITIAGGGGTWGSITGTLSSQTDLQTALDGKVDENTAITGATKTKITYDAKGLVTAGADATTADIADSMNRRYVTDAQLVVVGNTSGTNTGDNAVNSLYSGLATSKQDTLVSGTNIKTVNSTSLLGSGNISVAPASGIDATAIADGSVTSTEFQYINSLTSNAQTQIDTKTNKLITTNRQTASYTLVLSDADKLVEMNVATANNLTIPLNSSVAFSTGTQILLAQYGAGQTTIVATSGVTVRSNGGKLKLNAQYSGATLIKIASDEWYLFGDIA